MMDVDMMDVEWKAVDSGPGVSGSAVIAAVVLLFGTDASPRAEMAGRADPEPPATAAVSDTIRAPASLLAYMKEKRRSILRSLRTMPAERYREEFVPGQRTLGQQARHVVEMNYAVCSALADETPPTPSTGHDSPKEKIVELMRRSFEYCRETIVDHGDSVLSGAFRTPEGDSLKKAKMLFFLVGNWADHYGHFATYLRMSGLEPPDTWALPADILQATTRR